MSQFVFLQREWSAVFDSAVRAENAVHTDPRTACFYARRALELAVAWAYKYDPGLKLPYQDNLSALIHEPSFKQTAGEAVFSKALVIVTLGNRAVHSHRLIPTDDGVVAVRTLPCRVLARPHLQPDSAAGTGVGVRRERVAQRNAGAQAGWRATAAPRSVAARARREAHGAARQ